MALSRPAQFNLHTAAAQGDKEAIAILAVSEGFNVNALDANGKRAIDHAAENGQMEALVYLIDILRANLDEAVIEEEHRRYAQRSTSNHLTANAPTRYGVLHYAWQNSKENALEIITYLMGKDITPNAYTCRNSDSFIGKVMQSMDGSTHDNSLSLEMRTKILRLGLQKVRTIENRYLVQCMGRSDIAHKILLSEAILRGGAYLAQAVISHWKAQFNISIIDFELSDITKQFGNRPLTQFRFELIQAGLEDIRVGNDRYPFDPELSCEIMKFIKAKLSPTQTKTLCDFVSVEKFAMLENKLAATQIPPACANLLSSARHARFQYVSGSNQPETSAMQSGVSNDKAEKINTP